MATHRPVVSIYKWDDPTEKSGTMLMPHVLAAPLRPDWVRIVHKNMSKNRRQPVSVGSKVGYETAAASWGTGRAVARVPRVHGGGTHRAGQGAFGNMCRGGGRFSPTKTWRRWHRRINMKEKRNAVVTALAATALPPLVMARGHRIDEVAELPLVVTDDMEKMTRTRPSVIGLERLGLKEELTKIINSKTLRAGKGKARNRRHRMRTGPMIIYKEDNGITRAFRNIPGVETASVTRLNLLKLAPGGNFGRLVIWTEGAFRHLSKMYGTFKSAAPLKKNFHIPRPQMENADIGRIINSTEVQSVLRPKLEAPKKFERKKNALKNKAEMLKLNPYVKPRATDEERAAKRKAKAQQSKEYNKKHKKGDDTFWKKLMKAFETKPVVEEEGKEEEE